MGGFYFILRLSAYIKPVGTRDRSTYHAQLARVSFDEILDLTADCFFCFFFVVEM